MPSSFSVTPRLCSPYRLSLFVGLFGLTFLLLFVSGCGDAPKPQSTVKQEDPVEDFDWVMKRLARRLRPVSGGGLNVTDRKITHKLFPPDEETPHYTATITVLTKTSFLHGKRQTTATKGKEPKEKKSRPKLFDPLANDPRTQKEDDKPYELVDIPGTGSRVAGASSAQVGTRNREEESVFRLKYLEGRWQLAEQPEKENQQQWFEYALQ